MKRIIVFLLFLAPISAFSLPERSDHPVKGTTLTLTGEIVSLRCFALDPEKGRGPDHSKCAEASIRRGEPAGFLSDGVLYVLLGVSGPKVRPVLFASTREEVTLTGILVNQNGLLNLNVTGIQSLGKPVKAVPAAKPESKKEGLRKE